MLLDPCPQLHSPGSWAMFQKGLPIKTQTFSISSTYFNTCNLKPLLVGDFTNLFTDYYIFTCGMPNKIKTTDLSNFLARKN